MQWDPDIVEEELRNCDYFRDQSFDFVGRDVQPPDAHFNTFQVQLKNPTAQRAIEIEFATPIGGRLSAVFQVYLRNLATNNRFNLEEHLRQHHSVNLDSGFRYSDYTGSDRERVQALLGFTTDLLTKYAEQVLQGIEWPEVHFDWGGTR